MKRIILFATVHELQKAGHFLNPELERRLIYLHDRLSFQIILEEWSSGLPVSFACEVAEKLNLRRENVGTPHEPRFVTFTNPVNHPGHNGTLDPDWDAPGLSEYGPYENQEARESQMVKNIQGAMKNYETGLFIVGLAHLHSFFGKLISKSYSVTAYHWMENPRHISEVAQ